MLTLKTLKSVRLHAYPPGQRFMAQTFLRLTYGFPRKTQITFEGAEQIDRSRPVIFAMNHTDRYNYWPFQYWLYTHGKGMTATWVKGKYYEKPLGSWFMQAMNNIPLPSMGYVLTTNFRSVTGRAPSGDEYRALRDVCDNKLSADEAARVSDAAAKVLDAAPGRRRAYAHHIEAQFESMMHEVTRLNEHAMKKLGLHLLIFPQGTRSKRLSKGHIGLIQMAWHLSATIVPVGCNGSDRCYPGSSPYSKGGHITYRIGAPIPIDDPAMAEHRVSETYLPFSKDASARYGDRFQAGTDIIMDRINALLDPEYQYADDQESDGVQEVNRFV